jgi:SNF2 family DNA or RNA helicase
MQVNLNIEHLREYQLAAVNYIIEKKRCGLNLDMGLGKTISSLSAFVKIHNISNVKRLLIIAPLNVAKNVWHTELLRWEHTKHLKFKICCGNAKERIDALNADVDVYIINQENIPWMFVNGHFKYDMIIVDESSGFRSHSSKRFKTLKKFICEYMVLLTGTPIPNGYIDIWSQQYLIDHGALLGKNISAYRSQYFDVDFRGFKYTCKYPDRIGTLLARNWLCMKSEDYLTLPDKIINTIAVSIDNFKLYQKYEKEFYIKINEKELTAVNAGVLANKLLQYCNGAVYGENQKYIEIHSNKLDALSDLINSYPKENLLIAFNFKSDEERIKSRFPHAVTLCSKNITEIEKKWSAGQIPLLLCQCSTAKGLNLQKGGRIIIWFGLTWNLESYLQFNARLHRQGQLKPVLIYHLVATHCKDEFLMRALAQKNVTQESLFTLLKSDIYS